MAYVGGVNFMWFLAGFGAIAVASPFLWSRMREDQRNRILVIFDETIDQCTGRPLSDEPKHSRPAKRWHHRAGALPRQHGAEWLPSRTAQRYDLLVHRRRAGTSRLPGGSDSADSNHHPHHPRRHQVRQQYEPAHLRRYRRHACLTGRSSMSVCLGIFPGRRSDAPVFQLWRQLDCHNVPFPMSSMLLQSRPAFTANHLHLN